MIHTITAYKNKSITTRDQGNYIDGHILLHSALELMKHNDRVVVRDENEKQVIELRKKAA